MTIWDPNDPGSPKGKHQVGRSFGEERSSDTNPPPLFESHERHDHLGDEKIGS